MLSTTIPTTSHKDHESCTGWLLVSLPDPHTSPSPLSVCEGLVSETLIAGLSPICMYVYSVRVCVGMCNHSSEALWSVLQRVHREPGSAVQPAASELERESIAAATGAAEDQTRAHEIPDTVRDTHSDKVQALHHCRRLAYAYMNMYTNLHKLVTIASVHDKGSSQVCRDT